MVVSWSQLRMFIECPWRWRQKYIHGVKENELKNIAAEYGTKIHDELLRERKINLNLEILGTEVYIAGVYETEREPITLQGVVDIIAKDDDGLVIIDIKTYAPTLTDFMQVSYYAFILALKRQTVSKMYIYEANTHKLIEAPDCTKHVNQALILLQEELAKEQSEAKAGKHCRFCGYVEICPLQKDIWKSFEDMAPSELLKLYLYTSELEARLQAKIKELAKDHEVKYDKYIAKYDVLKSFKLKPVEKEQIYSKYGLEAFEIDKEFLKQTEPSLFEVIEKKTLKITKKEDE